MKLKINYDLLEKIKIANTGISLKKDVKGILECSTIFTALKIPYSSYEELMTNFLVRIGANCLFFGIAHAILAKAIKTNAIDELKQLSRDLKKIDISTNYELLLKAYKYKTDYEFIFNEYNNPKLKQKKYIMAPVYINGEEKEVSLVQEHTVGTKKYYLSYGSPKKEFKLASNPI